jgi:hypothetical protein
MYLIRMNKYYIIYLKHDSSKFMDVISFVTPLKIVLPKNIEIKIIVFYMKFSTNVINSLMTFSMGRHILHVFM